MKINLAILYGIDDKFGIVSNTIARCYNYFDKIFLINAGGEFTYNKIKHFSDDKVLILNVDNMWGDTSSPRRYAAKLCDQGDWILWLDSDECPSQLLLDNFKNLIDESEKRKTYHIKFGSSNHLYDNYGNNIDGCNPYQPTHLNYPYNYNNSIEQNTFAFNRLIKVTNFDSIGVNCSLGGHSIYSTRNGPVFSNYLINHYKTLRTCYKSATLHLWSSPIPNHNSYELMNTFFKSEEYKIHMDFIKKYKVKNSVELVQKIYNEPNFIETIRSVYFTDLFKNSQFHWNHIYKFLEEPYNFNLEDNAHTFKCDLGCCNYI
jgi:hypothetical protein